MNAAQIYTVLYTEKKAVSIPLSSLREYETLRRDLHRHHALMNSVEETALSLAGNFRAETGIAKFQLIPVRKREYTITIIDDQVIDDGS